MEQPVFLHRPELGGQNLLRHIAYGLFQLPEPLRSRQQVTQDQHLPLVLTKGKREVTEDDEREAMLLTFLQKSFTIKSLLDSIKN